MAETKLQRAEETVDVIVGFNWFGASASEGAIREFSGANGTTPLGPKTPQPTLNGLTSDPIAFYFPVVGGVRVLVIEREFDFAAQQSLPAYITVYNPQLSWTTPVVARQQYQYYDGTPVTNIYTAPATFSLVSTTLYGADYVDGKVFGFVYETIAGTTTEQLVTDRIPYYTIQPTQIETDPNFLPIQVYTSGTIIHQLPGQVPVVYAVAQQYSLRNVPSPSDNPENYKYYESILRRFSIGPAGELIDDYVPVAIAPNVFDIQLYDDRYLFVTCLGGPQWYGDPEDPDTTKWNEASRIQRIPVTNIANVENVFRPANSGEPFETNDMFDIRALVFMRSHAYILTGSYDSTFAYNGRLWQVDETFLISAQLPDPLNGTLISTAGPGGVAVPVETIEGVFGYFWALLPAEYVNKVWGIFGTTLALYDARGASGTPLTVDAATGGWHAGTGAAFNSMSVVLAPSGVAQAAGVYHSVHRAHGFVHPVLAKGHPTEVAEFMKAHSSKK